MPWAEESKRKAQLPADWQRIRLRVLRKAHYQCAIPTCTNRANQVDHIVPGNDHSEANLRALCAPCHATKSSLEGVEARSARGYSARRPSRHPGSLD